MKPCLKPLALLCAFLFTTASASAETLFIQGLQQFVETNVTQPLDGSVPQRPQTVHTQWYEALHALYPDVEIRVDEKVSHQATEEVINALTSPDAPDVFVLDSAYQDVEAVMASGTLFDWTDEPIVQQLLAQMHPSIAQVAYHDGRLYGLPIAVYGGFQVICSKEQWAYAGYSSDDMPTSFEGLLDFLDGWVERCQTDTYSSMWNIINKDNTGLSSIRQQYGYTDWLTTILVWNHIAQCRIEGMTPAFHTPVIIALLERTQALGAALDAYDHRNTMYSLFYDNINELSRQGLVLNGSLNESIFYQLPARLTNDEPLSMPLNVQLLVVNGQTAHADQALALLQTYSEQWEGFASSATGATFEQDTQKFAAPLLLKDWHGEILHSKNVYAAYTRAGNYGEIIDDLKAGHTESLRERRMTQSEATMMRDVPIVSLEVLQRYQEQIVPGMAFPAYGGFEAMGKEITALITRFSQGKVTAEEFAAQLDTLVTP